MHFCKALRERIANTNTTKNKTKKYTRWHSRNFRKVRINGSLITMFHRSRDRTWVNKSTRYQSSSKGLKRRKLRITIASMRSSSRSIISHFWHKTKTKNKKVLKLAPRSSRPLLNRKLENKWAVQGNRCIAAFSKINL